MAPRLLAFLILAILAGGCSPEEWLRISSDSGQQFTDNPPPLPTTDWLGLFTYVVTFLGGLFAKSAARGFGRGAKATVKSVKCLVTHKGKR